MTDPSPSGQPGDAELPAGGATSDSRPGAVTPWGETVKVPSSTPPAAGRTSSTPAVPDEASGQPPTARFGKFIRTKRLGAGGMGEVWKAWDTVLGRWVALKFLKGGDDEEVARFLREAQTAGRLHHPNIAAIFDVSQDQGRQYIAMQYVDGRTLHEFPRDDRKLLVRLIADAARALHFAHEQGVIHRDLKPENLMVTVRATSEGKPPEHHVYLMDFGLARAAEGGSKVSVTGFLIGTPMYMSPEQARGDKLDVRADVYSLGLTLYELLTSRRPFESASVYETLRRVQEEEPIAPRKYDRRIPADLETIVLKCVAKDPAARYPTAQALADDLNAWLAGDAIQGKREGFSRKILRRVRRHPREFAAAVILVIVLCVLGRFVLMAKRSTEFVTLLSDIGEGGRPKDWPEERVRKVEERLAELERVSPQDAVKIRADLSQRLMEDTRRLLGAGNTSRAREVIGMLERIDPQQAQRLRLEVREREGMWQPLAQLIPPFGDLKKFFDSRVKAEGERLVASAEGALLTKLPCEGPVELRAELDGWKSATQLGLVLNGTRQGGYFFLLLAGDPAATAPMPTFEAARAAGGGLRIQIRRNESLLKEEGIPLSDVPDGVVRLLARRQGERLFFQVNDRTPAEVRDPFPLGGGHKGFFGIQWPAGAGVRRILTSRQELPPAPSPLEVGNDFYVQNRFEEALVYYREAAQKAVALDLRQEARYKEGLCEVAANREDAALRIFEEVAGRILQAAKGEDTRWSYLSDCQLLLHYFKQKDGLEKANLILERLGSYDIGFESVAQMLPVDIQRQILNSTGGGSVAQNLHRKPEEHLARCEFSVKAAEILEPPSRRSDWKYHSLMRAHMIMGEHFKALRMAEKMFSQFRYGGDWLDDYSWILRLEKQPQQALKAIERGVELNPVHKVEQARVFAALDQWEKAQAALETYLEKPGPEYAAWSAACLALGYVLDQRGRPAAEVEAAWRRGLLKNWQDPVKGDSRERRTPLGMAILHNWILGSLIGEMTDADAEQLLAGLILFAGKDNPVFNRLMRPSMLRATWRTPRGREIGRQIAFRSIPFNDTARFPLYLGWIAFAREVCFASQDLSADQEELMWQLAAEIMSAYQTGLINERYLLPFAAIVAGNPNQPGMGWKEVAVLMEKSPRLRGPLAYLFGKRYEKRNDPANALKFFKSAAHDAGRDPENPLLRRLSQPEIERIEKN